MELIRYLSLTQDSGEKIYIASGHITSVENSDAGGSVVYTDDGGSWNVKETFQQICRADAHATNALNKMARGREE